MDFGARHRVPDRRGFDDERFAGFHARTNPVDVDVERHALRAVEAWPRPAEYTSRSAVTALHERHDRILLPRIGAFIYQ